MSDFVSTPPLYPTTVAFAAPVSTAALVGSVLTWETPAVRILRVEGGQAVFQLASGPADEDSGDYPLDSRTLGCPASGETPEAVAAEIAAYVLAPISAEQKLARAKAAKVREINTALSEALAAGITPAGAEFALSGVPAWRNKFTGLATIIQTALLGAADDTAKAAILAAETPLVAQDGTLHTLANSALLAALVSYGQQIQALEVCAAAALAAVGAATTPEEVAAITLPTP
ncbi:MAG TPA: hypothetical protein VIM61_00405 [Chthoniobacterales bacterium]